MLFLQHLKNYETSQFGRSKQLNETEILELQQRIKNGTLIRELMANYKLSKASIYHYLAQNKP